MSDTAHKPLAPHPWLVFLTPLGAGLLASAITWGTFRADQTNQERRLVLVEQEQRQLRDKVHAQDVTFTALRSDVAHIKQGVDAIQQALLAAGARSLVAHPPAQAHAQP